MAHIKLKKNSRRFIGFIFFAASIFFFAKTSLAQEGDLYFIQKGDVLEISVWKDKELTKQVLVRPDGRISFPLIGEVLAAGNTVSWLNEEVKKRVSEYVPEAVVTVMLLKMHDIGIYVVGKVNKPGQYNLPTGATVLQALAMANGLNPFAHESEILIIRGNGNLQKAIPFNYSEAKKGEKIRQNIELQDGDVIIVR